MLNDFNLLKMILNFCHLWKYSLINKILIEIIMKIFMFYKISFILFSYFPILHMQVYIQSPLISFHYKHLKILVCIQNSLKIIQDQKLKYFFFYLIYRHKFKSLFFLLLINHKHLNRMINFFNYFTINLFILMQLDMSLFFYRFVQLY